jgi:Putative zinc-finger
MERRMDHNQAMRSQTCEKYLLGELSPQLREAYEEHYFSCQECALHLRTASQLLGAARQILAAQPAIAAAVAAGPSAGGFAWLKLSIAVPTFAALLLFIGYQNFVTIRHYKQPSSPNILPMYSLIAGNTRGDQGLVFTVAPNQPLGLYVDVPANPSYSTYLLRLQDPSGAVVPLPSLTAAEAQKTQVITFNPARLAGNYALIISGLANPAGDPSAATELAHIQFSVVFKN